MKIAVVGGGPGGLYFSILTKKALPDCQIEVFERNKADDSFGFGVVFSDETLSEFLTRDPESYELIRTHFAYWDDLDIARDGEIVRISGNGFCGCSRKQLLQLLQQRCQEEGVKLHFETERTDLSILDEYDYVVAADGIASKFRDQLSEELGTQIELKQNRFVWMGSTRPLDAFTYWFKNTEHGAMVAHSYQYQEGMSTWIFECSENTWKNLGFDRLNEDESQQKLEQLFKEELDGHKLIQNKSIWRRFPHITNAKWHYKNMVLLGDAKATAHFSIGSGTKLAMESAIALSDAIVANKSNHNLAFQQYVESRHKRVSRIQRAAEISLDWFESMDRHISLPFYQFAFGVMTRAKKVTYENLKLRDPSFTDKVLEEFSNSIKSPVKSPTFTPFKIKGLSLDNRVIMLSSALNKSESGCITKNHFSHYTSRASLGPSLLISEFTSVNEDGRWLDKGLCLNSEEQMRSWRELCVYVHKQTPCKIGVQLGHAGDRASLKSTQKLSASNLPYSENENPPKALDREGMDRIISDFINATKMADEAGLDLIELHVAKGCLLGSFISPLTNNRTDEHGGIIENRIKFPLEVFKAVRSNFPKEKPVGVLLTVSDYVEGGISMDEAIAAARIFKEVGADYINVTTGESIAASKIPAESMYQTSFAGLIKNALDTTVISSGNITEVDQINTIILNGRADLIGIGEELDIQPGFVIDAAAYEGITELNIPEELQSAYPRLLKSKQYERLQIERMKKALKPKSHKKN